MKATLILLSLSLILSACNSKKQFDSWIKRHPEFAQNDTIRDTIHVVVPGVQFDTVVRTTIHDTVRIDTGHLHVRIIRIPTGSPCDTALIVQEVQGLCDTVFVDRPIETIVEKLVPCPEGYNARVHPGWRIAAGVLFLLIMIGVVIGRLTKRL